MYINAINGKPVEKSKRRGGVVSSSSFADYCSALAADVDSITDVANSSVAESINSVISLQDSGRFIKNKSEENGVLRCCDDMMEQLGAHHSKLVSGAMNNNDLQKMLESLLATEQQLTYNAAGEGLVEVAREIETLLAVEVAKLQLRIQREGGRVVWPGARI